MRTIILFSVAAAVGCVLAHLIIRASVRRHRTALTLVSALLIVICWLACIFVFSRITGRVIGIYSLFPGMISRLIAAWLFLPISAFIAAVVSSACTGKGVFLQSV